MKKLRIVALVIAAVGLAAAGVIWIFNMLGAAPVELDTEYYGEREMMELSAEEYEKLVAEKKSFVVMVDNPGCKTTERMREMMAGMPLSFRYYRMMWEEAKKTNIHDFVNYFPSMVVISKGEVKHFLRADADEDAVYYNSAADLERWMRERVRF